MSATDKVTEDAKKAGMEYAMDWGKSSLPPTILATFITALHARPYQFFPMLFPPILLFSTYLNLSSYVVDSAGITAAWSGLYLIMASRRKPAGLGIRARLSNKFVSARGLTRGAAMTVAGANVVGGGLTYVLGKREDDESQ